MILKKQQFKFQKKYRGQWPFTVPEVGIGRIDIEGVGPAFYVLHDLKTYALSGILESHGFAPLESSGIWQSFGDFNKSLDAIFEFLQERVK